MFSLHVTEISITASRTLQLLDEHDQSAGGVHVCCFFLCFALN